MKKALVTGITGQDGSYLAELLLEKGYEVYGLVRRSSAPNTARIDHLLNGPDRSGNRFKLVYGDVTDGNCLTHLIGSIKPEEIYNLASQSHVGLSFETPIYTADATALGALRLLEAIRRTGVSAKFYQASSSEMFGLAQEVPQTEKTPFYPRSPYAASKVFAYWVTVNYREAYHLFTCNGILFNHESPRRGEAFVTRKITRAVAHIKLGLQKKLYLGNLDAKRDWGYAKEYVEAMWLMLQHDNPDDYVVATGETRTVREFLDEAFSYVDLDFRDFVEQDPRFLCPTEVHALVGNPTKARTVLGWKSILPFRDLVRLMVEADLELAQREKASGVLVPHDSYA